MTSYYKGNNIGLNYDAANATWSFDNEPNDFIDPDSFSTADPAFDYTPPSSDDDDQDQDDDFNPCPPGYIYDSTLKQCVPDPNQQTSYQQGTGGGSQDRPPVKIAGTNRYTTDNNFIASDEEYENMSAEEFVENYKQRGMVGKNQDGNLFIDLSKMKRKGSVLDYIFSRYVPKDPVTQEKIKKGDIPRPITEAEASVRKSLKYMFDKNIAHGDLNQDLFNFKPLGMGTVDSENFPLTKLFEKDKENYKIILPTKQAKDSTIAGTTGTQVISGWGDKVFDTSHGVYERGDDVIPSIPHGITTPQDVGALPSSVYAGALNEWKNNANLVISNSASVKGTLQSSVFADALAQQKVLKAEAETKKAKWQAEREMQKTISEAEKVEKVEKERDEIKKEIKTNQDKQKMQSTIRQAEKEQKSRAQDVATGKFSGSPSRGGTSLGSSVHGSGSYTQSKPSRRQSGPQPGKAGWKR